MNRHWLTPDWPVPDNIKAASTLRTGGSSTGCFSSLNLGLHVGDDAGSVAENRDRLKHGLKLPSDPFWLNQVHGSVVIDAASAIPGRSADASYSSMPGVVCSVMTADCLPVLFYNHKTGLIAVAHGGWRGLLNGVIEATLAVTGPDCIAWLGPAIGPQAFDVGAEVREAFVQKDVRLQQAFERLGTTKYRADIFAIGRCILQRQGVNQIYGGDCCTYSDPDRFFSYRRDGNTGRMATLIWRD